MTLLAPKQAAHLLGVTPAALRQWRHRRTGPVCIRFSDRAVLYPAFPLLAFGLKRLIKGA